MTWLLKSDSSFKAIRHVDNDIIQLNYLDFIYLDKESRNNYQNARNIFATRNKLEEYFNVLDANYFVDQIKRQRKYKWNLKLEEIILFDTIQLVDNRVDKVLFSYSLPLFSVDNNYVIIIEAFYCGLLCGGGVYNVYQRLSDNSWKKIKQLNQWGE